MKNVLPNLDKNEMVIFCLTRLGFLTARTKCSFVTAEAETVVYRIRNDSPWVIISVVLIQFSVFVFKCSEGLKRTLIRMI